MTGRAGVALALGAYGMWGLFPLYFRLLQSAGAVEIVLHRIVWSLLTCLVLIAAARAWAALRAVTRRQVLLLAAAAAVLSINWGVFIWAVNTEQVVETSLGYFINPLVSVLLGVLLLHERLRRAQWVAVGIAASAVVVLTVDYGRPPWIALALAASFGSYGLLKNRVGQGSGQGVGALPGLTVETAVLFLPALAGVLWLQAQGSGTLVSEGPWHTTFLVLSGALTAAPLLLFAAAARRVPLSTIGLLQYVTPVMQLLIGTLVFGEPMPPLRLAGFALVWCALVVLTADGLRTGARARAQARAEARLAEATTAT
ncbi:EamA family transporter RarD [Aquipuribacter nitratireducens]|uniref:EamA family transporter RarD n=1 Tax=Aquipuribacter nitratireducens TaxID=650104 RepID=A0ABW0GLP8_9MICO